MNLTKEIVESLIKTKGYYWNNSKNDFVINIVGIRNSNPTGTSEYEDNIVVSYKENNIFQLKNYTASLRPNGNEILNFFSLYFGIDLKGSSFDWQQGGRIFKEPTDFDEFMTICKNSRVENGDNSFTFTVVDSNEL